VVVLRRLAMLAQEGRAGSADQRTISESVIIREIKDVLADFNMDAKHAHPVLDEIVHRSELLLLVDETNLLYQFAHLTLQEYLAATELADDPERLLSLYHADPERWREPVKLWCAAANRDSTKVISSVFSGESSERVLALECIAEAKQVDNEVAATIVQYGLQQLAKLEDPLERSILTLALGSVAADPGPGSLRSRLSSA
jgi:hypothetical protein